MSDLEAYRSVIEGLREQAQSCKVHLNFFIFKDTAEFSAH